MIVIVTQEDLKRVCVERRGVGKCVYPSSDVDGHEDPSQKHHHNQGLKTQDDMRSERFPFALPAFGRAPDGSAAALTFHSNPPMASPAAAAVPATPTKWPLPMLLAKSEAPIWGYSNL